MPVLYGAFRFVSKGWMSARDLDELYLSGKPRPEGVCALWEALARSSQDRTTIDVEYARRLVRKFEFLFNKWEGYPGRTREDVLRLLQRAIVLGGGDPPHIPFPRWKSRHHAGGWIVSSRRAN